MGVHKYYHYEMADLICAQPEEVHIPVQMHIGPPAVPTVAPGDRVKWGDLIAAPQPGKLGARIHASMDGRVAAVGETITIVKE